MASVVEAVRELLQCPLCLDMFHEPVSTPCGHTFCQSCFDTFWNSQRNSAPSCPMCMKGFNDRPVLHINFVLRNTVETFRMMSAIGEKAGRSVDTTASNGNSRRGRFMARIGQQTNTFPGLEWALVKKYAVAVTLDETTAHPSLIFHAMGKTIRVNSRKRRQRFRPCPGRFTTIPCVLGSSPLCPWKCSSWEVGIFSNRVAYGGPFPSCFIGVATESTTTKRLNDSLHPENGFWVLEYVEGRLGVRGTPVLDDIIPCVSTMTIGVSYNGKDKTVHFYKDQKCIYTFINVQASGERLFPAFCLDDKLGPLSCIIIY